MTDLVLFLYGIGIILVLLLSYSIIIKAPEEAFCLCSGPQCRECVTDSETQQQRIRKCNYPKELIGVV